MQTAEERKFILDDYSQNYESEFRRACRDYATELLSRSGVDLEQNKKTVQAYDEQMSAYNESEHKRATFNALYITTLVIAVIAFSVFMPCGIIFTLSESLEAGIIFLVLCVSVPVALLVLAFVYLKEKREFYKQKAYGHEYKAQEYEQEGLKQLQPFNDSFETSDTHELISRVVPVLKLYPPDNRRYDYFSGKFSFWISADIDDDYEAWATENAVAGSVYGNPFLSYRERICKWGEKEYSNSITIEWTEEERDSDGEWHTEHYSEKLTARVTKPIPCYHRLTRTVCGSNGTEISFARLPSKIDSDLELVEQNVYNNGFIIAAPPRKKPKIKEEWSPEQQLAARFYSSFGDCDAEGYKEFFSGEAQKNIRKVLNGYYGDDFIFYKRGNLNYVASAHAAKQSLDTSYTRYASFDYEQTVNNFVEFNCEYLKSLIYDLSVVTATGGEYSYNDYVYADGYNRNYSSVQAECVLQNMPQKLFVPPEAATEAVLTPKFLRCDGGCDELLVTVHSYSAENCVDIVSKHGGDGAWHDIDVVWQNYNLIECTRIAKIKRLPTTDKKFAAFTLSKEVRSKLAEITEGYGFYDGFFCCVVESENAHIDERLNEIFKPLLND